MVWIAPPPFIGPYPWKVLDTFIYLLVIYLFVLFVCLCVYEAESHEAGFKLRILLPLTPECWDCEHVPP